jgi:hypothetical protein
MIFGTISEYTQMEMLPSEGNDGSRRQLTRARLKPDAIYAPFTVIVAPLRAGRGRHQNDVPSHGLTSQRRWGAFAGVTTTRAEKSRMSVKTAPLFISHRLS